MTAWTGLLLRFTVDTLPAIRVRPAMGTGAITGSDLDRDPVPGGASDTEAARSRDGGCPGILGQACR